MIAAEGAPANLSASGRFILRMAALHLGDVAEFPFIEAPSSRLTADGYLLLPELGAVDARRQITGVVIRFFPPGHSSLVKNIGQFSMPILMP